MGVDQAARWSTDLIVFAAAPGGGNPCTVTVVSPTHDAAEMEEFARQLGWECVFIFSEDAETGPDYRFRFFSPAGEMAMCGHASIGAAWLLAGAGAVRRRLRIETASGDIVAQAGGGAPTMISQPFAAVRPVCANPAAVALALEPGDLGASSAISASTSRGKVLIEINSLDRLNRLEIAPIRIREACEAYGTTGLYAWARAPDLSLHARQFPYDAGYVEDPATGIAAAGLFFALGAPATGITVFQGEGMGRPSRIEVRPGAEDGGCWVGGEVAILLADLRPAAL